MSNKKRALGKNKQRQSEELPLEVEEVQEEELPEEGEAAEEESVEADDAAEDEDAPAADDESGKGGEDEDLPEEAAEPVEGRDAPADGDEDDESVDDEDALAGGDEVEADEPDEVANEGEGIHEEAEASIEDEDAPADEDEALPEEAEASIEDEDAPADEDAALPEEAEASIEDEDAPAEEVPDGDVADEDLPEDEASVEGDAEDLPAEAEASVDDEDEPVEDEPDADEPDEDDDEDVPEDEPVEAEDEALPDAAAAIQEDESPQDEELTHAAEVADATSPEPSRKAWHRLGRAGRPRPTKANVLATVLALGLGFAIAAQVHQTSLEGLEDLREDELIRILDTVDQNGSRLAEEIQSLQTSRDRLKSTTTSLTEAQEAAQQRLDTLAIMAGTVPARGPGIVLTIRDPEQGVTAPLLLDTLQELRDAGAEAVEINNVRVVANTFFTDGEGGISISGTSVSAPYVVTAIGDGSTLASAMEIPGGVTESVRTVRGEATVETKDEVTVSALQTVSEPQYARPVPSPTTS